MRKIIVGIGLFLCVVGLAFLVFQAQEEYAETVDVYEWNLQSEPLAPSGENRDSTFYGRYMDYGMWFQLNVSSSNSIELQVSRMQHDPDLKIAIFDQIGIHFDQKISGLYPGTYVIDIKNESPSWVTLDGSVLVRRLETNHRNVYPYTIPGFLIMLGGTGVLVFGIFRKPKKLSKSKRV